MGTNESSKEQAILEQYKMGEQEARSVKAWARIYSTDEIMGSYLEKSGYPFKEHIDPKESSKYFEQYKMREQEARSVQAWTDFYETEDLLDAYLEKSGYPTNHDLKEEKPAA
ncbi:hypothetical protein [Oxalobacter paraformigenes]|uniref:Uncharacterized protein n=1 Tax=Oxalobacter paraformigenes TaxID=556268 RepID=C3X2Y0_9BURK|nr:hypothetical protein [Oxalobacter paraformigenes]EEO27566.1 hypothetical protein OFAG_00719 [Oxalobacter paraformigenes]